MAGSNGVGAAIAEKLSGPSKQIVIHYNKSRNVDKTDKRNKKYKKSRKNLKNSTKL